MKNGLATLTLVEKAVQEFDTMVKENDGSEQATNGKVEDVVSISLRKSLPKRVINLIASLNNAELVEADDSYVIKANYLKVSRADIEGSIGKISDARWRMLFINRDGEVKEFNNYEFLIGAPKQVEAEEDEKKETVQMNIRIDKAIKDDVEKFRHLLGDNYTQNSFVEDALKEFIANIRRELI